MAPSEEKKTSESQEASGGDITRLDFATFFDNNEPTHSELGSKSVSVSKEETTKDSEHEETETFSEPAKLADIVKQIDRDSSPTDSEPKGAAEMETLATPTDDDNVASFGEFVADFDAVDDDDDELESSEKESTADEAKGVLEDLEAVSTSNNDKQAVVEHSTSVDEAISEGESSQSVRNTSSRGDESSGSVSEENETTTDGSNSENSTSDIAIEEDEESMEQGTMTPSSADDTSIDFATYERVAALLVGMNREKIDFAAAQQMVSVASQHDSILSGFKSLLLHPQCVRDGRLHKHESDALRAWIKAQDLGLLDKVVEGNAWAQLLKGWFLVTEDKDYASARTYYELAAEQGNALAQASLGSFYEMGCGVRKDCAKAKEYYELSAGQGNANAQCGLGRLYIDGKGLPQDFERARHLFELAAEQDHAWAQSKLGNLYKEGTGVEQDYEKAKHYYEMAVRQGFATAQCDLGNMYVKGTGVQENYELARHLYELAVAQGCPEAQNNLGHLYKNGMGVNQDYEKAKHYYSLAAAQGFAGGQSSLDSLEQASCVIS